MQLLTVSPIYDYLTARGFKAEKEYVVIEGWLEEEALAQAVETEFEGVRAGCIEPPLDEGRN